MQMQARTQMQPDAVDAARVRPGTKASSSGMAVPVEMVEVEEDVEVVRSLCPAEGRRGGGGVKPEMSEGPSKPKSAASVKLLGNPAASQNSRPMKKGT
ncbi:hypothetical protein N0V84_011143 [Fusarium piperis]|uniref:Uncharacterized protein n=1 Tax=Fusarium piperis TaxID=1435070 RepID=A0A9W8TCH0_9HYPO|nr:hypothetical protein N0V84_011143 [Fusarium piperis]